MIYAEGGLEMRSADVEVWCFAVQSGTYVAGNEMTINDEPAWFCFSEKNRRDRRIDP